MVKIKKINNLVEKIWMIFLSLILIIGVASVYYTVHTYLMIIITSCILIITVLPKIILMKNKIEVTPPVFIMGIIYIIAGIFLPVFWGKIGLYYIYVVFILMPLLFLYTVSLIKSDKLVVFATMFVKVCIILACISVFIWIFGSTLRLIKPTGISTFLWGDSTRSVNTYFNVYFETQNAGLNLGNIHIGVKNNSIFAEAPMCCFVYICASILNEMFVKMKSYRCILVIMILSTLTTTGQIYITMLALYYLFNWHPKRKSGYNLKVLMIIILSSLAAFLIFNMLHMKTGTISGNDRIRHILNEWVYFKSSPIYGAGFDVFTNGTSNSIVALLADGGILLWGLYYFPLIWVVFHWSINRKEIKLNTVLFTVIFSFTAAQYTPIALLMIDILFIYYNYGGQYDVNK